MIEHLKANDGQGIICETEADTMSVAKKQDWGDYSTILRAAFHHETFSTTRKTDKQYDEIKNKDFKLLYYSLLFNISSVYDLTKFIYLSVYRLTFSFV
jgi:hypothetical protein